MMYMETKWKLYGHCVELKMSSVYKNNMEFATTKSIQDCYMFGTI
jgi:hypothetical protein